jgi:hypothetical protein
MTMIEKVARAISMALGKEDWTDLLAAARAAVLALSDPTNDMLEAGLPGLPDYGFLEEEYRTMLLYVATEKPNLTSLSQEELFKHQDRPTESSVFGSVA